MWIRNDGTFDVVQYATRQAQSGGNATFSAATDLTEGASTNASGLHLAVDQQGDAVGVWQTGNGLIQAAYMPGNNFGAFGAPQTLETDGTNKPINPTVAIDAAGDAEAVWEHSDGTNLRMEALYGPGGTFGATPQVVSPAGHPATTPQVAMDSAGDAVAVWLESDGTNIVVQGAARPAGSATTFSTIANLESGAVANNPHLAMDAGGDAAAVWEDSTNKSIDAAFRPSAQTNFGSVQTLRTDAVNPPTNPSVAFDGLFNAYAVWQHVAGGHTLIEESTALAAGTFAAESPISSASDDANHPQVAADSNGDAAAVWENTTTGTIDAAVQPSGQAFGAATAVVTATANPALAPSVGMDGHGNAIAGWDRSDNANTIAQAIGYDNGPQLPNVHIPSAPYAGHAVTFSAQTSDVWSPVNTNSWDFGDGSSPGVGPQVIHTYSSPGSETATYTATDAAGVSATTNQSVVVANKPAAAPGGLFQLDSPNDCADGVGFGCGTALPYLTNFAYQPVVSPDGHNAYFISLVGSVGEFTRDPGTGALTQLGCLTGNSLSGCTQVNNGGLNGPAAAVLSPDGKNVYVVTQGDNAVVSLSRDPSTGALSFGSCIEEGGGDCSDTSGTGLGTPYGVAISPDGNSVYVASITDQAVAEFSRNPSTGALTETGCISGATTTGCTQNAPGMGAPIGVTVSPDGANVYVENGGTSGNGDVAEFSRDPTSGNLTQLSGANDCISNGVVSCGTSNATIDGTEDMALSPDGRFAYVNSSQNGEVIELSRNTSTGALAQIGCVTSSASGCAVNNSGALIETLGVAVSPDGANLYVSGAATNSESAFARDPGTGLLTPLATPFNCITNYGPGTFGCGQAGAAGLQGARRVAVSPDGKNLYVAGQGSGAIAVFARSPADADLALSVSGAPASVTKGGSFAYTYTIKNNGPANVADPVLTVTLAAQLKGTTAAPSQGSCTGETCNLGPLPAGATATVQVPVTAIATGTAVTTATVSDSAEVVDPNQANNSVSSSTAVQAQQTPPPPVTVPSKSLPNPVLHKNANVLPVQGSVRVELPGSKKFVLLSVAKQIPLGSIVDATHGTVELVFAKPGGGTIEGQFFSGEFTFTQAKNGAVTVTLVGGSFSKCPKARKTKTHALIAVIARGRPVRQLWSNVHGNFTTRGRSASGSVRGTEWLTQDYCDGTNVHVTRGIVLVTDLVNHRSKLVHAGHSVFDNA